MKLTLHDRLMAGIRVDGDCWMWTRAVDRDGYGRIAIEGGNRKVHRAAFALWVGSIKAEHSVCHRCDRPACINPDHLFLGTQADNMRDMAHKGRRLGVKALFGERHGMAKLSNADVRAIRAATCTQAELARRFGVSAGTINMILRGKTWRTAL